ncbi:jg6886 [Pararge aegeria aegeria]|uniref:Jg6886 protein n=1 Tax=Pararge aegeria aegeria TaxID=348720 RepID=A0A8S4RM13_9NEOP|nr:jg6886 [Pararge aegeria aegeria]
METVEEHPVLNTAIDVVKPNTTEEASAELSNVCHKSNGVDCDVQAEGEHSEANEVPPEPSLLEVENEKQENVTISDKCDVSTVPETELEIPLEQEGTVTDKPDSKPEIEVVHDTEIAHIDEIPHDEVITETVIETEKEICIEEGIVTMIEMESSIPTVHFETEILVEETDDNVSEMLVENQESGQTNNMLNELGSNIELSEVLRSSDVSENVENNNSTVKQEIFNKEELLDILEGNDNLELSANKTTETSPNTPIKISDAEIAMQQFSRLSKRKFDLKVPKIKRGEKSKSPLKDALKAKNLEKEKQLVDDKKKETGLDNTQSPDHQDNNVQQSQLDEQEQGTQLVPTEQELSNNKQQQAETGPLETYSDNIVKTLVMDWEDEPTENNEANSVFEEGEALIKDLEELKKKKESRISKNDTIESVDAIDSPSAESQIKLTKADDDGPTRRLSRVIKKKVIFDPDNPDTFTKGKSNKAKETLVTKEQTTSKKGKSDQIIQRSKSKSPLKLQWKKPSTKNSKQHKRLTEVDRLLMDEGAVNMIYQLTPEAPKGKKNVRTKAEFIKKIQSSTPDGKEMKFRERKKESKYEDGEAKTIVGGKHRPSLSSSAKSPCVSEDFETHSADDSIIYRRHSSSSYSSSCMSPRRLSDVETGNTQSQSVTRISQQPMSDAEINPRSEIKNVKEESLFKSEIPKLLSGEMINRNDCLSIKEKLNSKLSLALNKRKRENSKSEKPAKQKKIVKSEENMTPLRDERLSKFQFISVTFDQRLALVCIKKTGLKICVEILKELEDALNYIDNRNDISITLLESQCGTLCSSLDLSLLLDENKEIRANHAYELAESVRSLLSSVARHSKLLCCGVWGACAGVALALVALSDVALASEGASFWLAAAAAPILPGAAALTARCRALPQALVNDLVIFGRRLSASEALQGGLVSRVLWPDRFDEQVQNIAKDIAAQPLQVKLNSNSNFQSSSEPCLFLPPNSIAVFYSDYRNTRHNV